jgi:hypothetical protein
MKRPLRAAALAAAALAASCRRPPEPYGPVAAFVPVAFRANNPGRPIWATRVTLTNTSGAPSAVRLTRWPPEAPDAEETVFDLAPGEIRSIPARIPLGTASSLFFESRIPFRVAAEIVDRRGLAPPLAVPVLPPSDLALPGDRLRVGPLVDTASERSHFCFTYPGVERDAVPFRVRLRLLSPGGESVLRETVFVLTGLPLLIDDPWKKFHLVPGTPFDAEVTFLGSVRSRPVARGLWVYGITTAKATGASRFLETRVTRRSAR